jgi:hypothetical protein
LVNNRVCGFSIAVGVLIGARVSRAGRLLFGRGNKVC